MQNETPSSLIQQRWFRMRKLVYPLVLLAGCVIAYITWDALFMPADLRQMQGAWEVRHIDANGERANGYPQRVVINGRAVIPFDDQGNAGEAVHFDIEPQRREMVVYTKEEIKLMGAWIRLPIWLHRPAVKGVAQYRVGGDKLILTSPENQPHQMMEFVRETK